MAKKKASKKQAKARTSKAAQAQPTRSKASRAKSPSTTSSRKASAKAVKGTKPKSKKPTASEMAATSSAGYQKYIQIKLLLGELDDRDLRGLWLMVYGYGDDVTEGGVPDDRDVLVGQLADRAYELEPGPEEMTPKGLAELIDDAS